MLQVTINCLYFEVFQLIQQCLMATECRVFVDNSITEFCKLRRGIWQNLPRKTSLLHTHAPHDTLTAILQHYLRQLVPPKGLQKTLEIIRVIIIHAGRLSRTHLKRRSTEFNRVYCTSDDGKY